MCLVASIIPERLVKDGSPNVPLVATWGLHLLIKTRGGEGNEEKEEMETFQQIRQPNEISPLSPSHELTLCGVASCRSST